VKSHANPLVENDRYYCFCNDTGCVAPVLVQYKDRGIEIIVGISQEM